MQEGGSHPIIIISFSDRIYANARPSTTHAAPAPLIVIGCSGLRGGGDELGTLKP